MMKARIINVKTEEGKAGLFYATSPDLRGLLVAESTLTALERETPKMIVAMYAALGVDVVVTRVEDDDDDLVPWVAFPAELAEKALASMRANC